MNDRPSHLATLAPFGSEQAPLIASWARDATELAAWCGHATHPLHPDVVLAWQADPDVRAFVLLENRPLAYGELWVDVEADEVELARLIVAPALRGRGLGQRLVGALLGEARATGLPNAYLRVVSDNTAAIRCYEASGFRRVPPEQETLFNAGQPRLYAWFHQAL